MDDQSWEVESQGRMTASGSLTVEGNHASQVVWQADWDPARVLKIGLPRTVGERDGANDLYVILAQAESEVPAVRTLLTESLNIAE